jgi:hypothetical protein
VWLRERRFVVESMKRMGEQVNGRVAMMSREATGSELNRLDAQNRPDFHFA